MIIVCYINGQYRCIVANQMLNRVLIPPAVTTYSSRPSGVPKQTITLTVYLVGVVTPKIKTRRIPSGNQTQLAAKESFPLGKPSRRMDYPLLC